ncbi:type I-D CRISPR-associated protein Cas7/Csc2 [Methanocalculus sp.]|uniref:type I-D CRISPR-associated protein Cas7/Csc2 n=1 Tax=Methanocalculus sp. TaxID=2004547 RepID=UPI00261F897D|nr:type I-D CRISPR-associated protein Cas7/Csc2 [Methanocalculus sp.]MDG6249262.1 type I-D CRISPR-associated protein Cas7/Csc2 [Methanocalculus sp.]
MSTKIDEFKQKIADYTLEKPERKPRQNYVSVLILRELQSAARFTTDGTEANSAVIRIGDTEATVGKLFGRKQVASDRRVAKALQRTLISEQMNSVMKKGVWDGCSMEVTKMCQRCPDCALFGSAASDEGISITSRVMYDEAYSIRSISTIVEEYFQNAPGDNYAKSPTSGIREPDFFKEGTLFPCVVTLKDATPEEVLFFLNITDRNTRYGATGTRFGKVRNHILGVYAGYREGPSSLEVTRGVAMALAGSADREKLKGILTADTLSLDMVCEAAVSVYESLAEKQRVKHDKFDTDYVSKVLSEMKDDAVVKEILETQLVKVGEYVSAD